MWLYHCGPQWAKRLLLTGDSLTGEVRPRSVSALKSLPADQLEAEVMRLADAWAWSIRICCQPTSGWSMSDWS